MALSPRMPDLAALEVLLAVARTGSLGAAGRELGLSQQAVSARVAAVEAQTGVPLVVRSPRGSTLTENGRLVAQWADRLIQTALEVDAGLAALRARGRTRVRVAASQTVAEQLLPGWLVSLRASASRAGRAAPEVVLAATNSDHVLAAVRSGMADLGFVEGPHPPRGLRSRVVAHDELVVVVAQGHRWARRHRLDPATLAREPLVTREAGSGTRDALVAALQATLGAEAEVAEPALELSSAAAVRAAVLAGAGPAVMSLLTVGDDLSAGRLRRLLVGDLDLRRELRAVWSGPRTPPAGAVRDLLAHIGALAR